MRLNPGSRTIVISFLSIQHGLGWSGFLPSRGRFGATSLPSATIASNPAPIWDSSTFSTQDLQSHELQARQTQEVVNVDGDCVQPTKAFVGTTYCASYANTATTQEECRTLWTSTTGCHVTTDGPLVHASGPVVSVECIQGDCAECSVTATTSPECTDCITSDSTVFASQATAFPSGTVPPIFTGPLPPLSSDTVSPPSATSAAAKLTKRTMQSPGQFKFGYDDFMVEQCNIAGRMNLIVPFRNYQGPGISTSSAKIRSFRNVPFTMAMGNLVGCTAVVVVSRRGVWMGHHWEQPSFWAPDGNSFNEDVLLGTWTGDTSGLFPGIGDYVDDIFKQDVFGSTTNVLKIFIVTSTYPGLTWDVLPEGAPAGAQYWKFMPEIWQLYNSFIDSGLGTPEVVNYDWITKPDGMDAAAAAAWRAELNQRTANGKVVIQYDPQQYWISQNVLDANGQVVASCMRPYAAWRLYVDQRGLIGEDTWDPMQEQLVGTNVVNLGSFQSQQQPQQRRANEQKVIDWSQPVCILTNATTTTTATAPPTATCRFHLYEQLFDDVKNDSQVARMEARFEQYDWQDKLLRNVSWTPQHNITENFTVTDTGNSTKTIFNANFAEMSGILVEPYSYDPSFVYNLGIGVEISANNSMLSWNIESDMDNSTLPYCDLGGWTTTEDISSHPGRDMDCWYPCNGTLPKVTTTSSTGPITTCRVVATPATITSGTSTYSGESYCLCDNTKSFGMVSTRDSAGRCGIGCPVGSSTMDMPGATCASAKPSSITSCSVVPTPATVIYDNVTYSGDSYCTCDGARKVGVVSTRDSTGRCSVACAAGTINTLTMPSATCLTTATASAAPTLGVCRVHITERVYSEDQPNGYVQPSIMLYNAKGDMIMYEDFAENGFASAYILKDKDGNTVVDATFQVNSASNTVVDGNPDIVSAEWPEYLAQVKFTSSFGEVTVLSNETDPNSQPYCGVGVWTSQTIVGGEGPPTRDMDCYFQCPSDFDPPSATTVPSSIPTTAPSSVPKDDPVWCRIHLMEVMDAQNNALATIAGHSDKNPILSWGTYMQAYVDEKQYDKDFTNTLPMVNNITKTFGDNPEHTVVLNYGVGGDDRLHPDAWQRRPTTDNSRRNVLSARKGNPHPEKVWENYMVGIQVDGLVWYAQNNDSGQLPSLNPNTETPPPKESWPLLPYCQVGAWDNGFAEWPDRQMDCWWQCGGKDVNAPTPTVTVPYTDPTSPAEATGVARVHITEHLSGDQENPTFTTTLTFYDTSGSESSSEDYAAEKIYNGFTHVWSIKDINNNSMVDVSFNAAPPSMSNLDFSDVWQGDYWDAYVAKVVLYTPNDAQTVLSSTTDSSKMPHCGVGDWTTDDFDKKPTRDMDCYFNAPYGWN